MSHGTVNGNGFGANGFGQAQRTNGDRGHQRVGSRGSLGFKAAIEKVIHQNKFRKVASILSGSGVINKLDVLCKICSSLELSVEKFIVKDRSEYLWEAQMSPANGRRSQRAGKFEFGLGSSKYELGTLRRIWLDSVYCSFCRLVMKSLSEQQAAAWIDIGRSPPESPDNEAYKILLKSLCFISWQIDGRDLKRDADGNLKSSRAQTRRIHIHWQANVFEEAYLVLVSNLSLPSLGRKAESAKSNPVLIKGWINTCKAHHGHRCEVIHDKHFQALISQAYFGVIDVHEMRLTRLPKGARFVALSYTWGKTDLFKTKLKNVRELMTNRGLDGKRLAPSITGAIQLVKDLGERWLWIDSLCIIQDSPKSWELNSKVMDVVYGNAYITICAADGDDPHAGLIAMDSSKRHISQHIEAYNENVLLMISKSAESYVTKSTWNTRAWTFQERLLSKRCVIFTAGRVFFQCRSAAMREDLIAEEETGWSIEHANAPLQMLENLETRALQIYNDCVALYTARKLSRPTDILSAFTGIGNLVGNALGAGLIHGLPRSHFDWALLWEPQGAPEHRDISRFPTWSWCGWENETIKYSQSTTIGLTTNIHDWLLNHTWISWYIRDGLGNLRLIWNNEKDKKNSDPSPKPWDGYGSSPAAQRGATDAYGRSLLSKWPDETRSTFFKTLPDVPFGVSISFDDIATDIRAATHPYPAQLPDQHYLQFWTWSAYFHLTDHVPSEKMPSPERNLRRFGITDYKGDWCGTIVLPTDFAVEQVGFGSEYQFLAISEAKRFSQDENNGWMYYIPREQDQSEWDLYYVLLVEVKDEIAYRVGLGKVYKEAFENSCREPKEWKEFILG